MITIVWFDLVRTHFYEINKYSRLTHEFPLEQFSFPDVRHQQETDLKIKPGQSTIAEEPNGNHVALNAP